MSKTNTPRKRAASAKAEAAPAETAVSAPVETAPAGEVDPRDEEIARLEARLAELTAPPPPADPKEMLLAELRWAVEQAEAAKAMAEPDREMDARDRTIAELRSQLEQIRATPEGAHAELMRSFAALQAQVDAMATGTGKVPVPVNEKPDPWIYGANLACGCVTLAQHPHATATFCAETDGTPRHGTVEVRGYWRLAEGEKPADTHAELARLREEVKGLRGRVMGAASAPAASVDA